LIYNVERADQGDLNQAIGAGPLKPEWRGDLLGGVMVLTGTWADGKPLLAVPNFARMNRLGQEPAGSESVGNSSVNYAPGATVSAATTTTNAAAAQPGERRRRNRAEGAQSMVWIKEE
jgi:hypothetical protein